MNWRAASRFITPSPLSVPQWEKLMVSRLPGGPGAGRPFSSAPRPAGRGAAGGEQGAGGDGGAPDEDAAPGGPGEVVTRSGAQLRHLCPPGPEWPPW